ncbi:MAG: YidC/Oxa1 family membrane protein insertase [Clostridiales bacterium]|nr:YidC/Oxa1 family membrane protein insertase [Clostridiales bacterium]
MRFGFVGDLLRSLLDLIYHVVPNYGWAVILFTLVIRLVLMPLDIKSKRSMKNMSKLQPQLEALNKKYAKDREKLNQKTQELYKKEKINPLSGCLPLLIQMPILFAMFAVMREVANEQTVAMLLGVKDALAAGNVDYRPVFESFFWIKNVFQPDSFMSTVVPAAVTDVSHALQGVGASGAMNADMINAAKTFLATPEYASWEQSLGATTWYSTVLFLNWKLTIPMVFNGWFVLPVLAAVSQVFASKLMAPSTAPAQATSAPSQANSTNQMMTYIFPIFSLFICATSNAAFALYWVFVNLIQLAQQLLVNWIIDRSEAKTGLSEEATKR